MKVIRNINNNIAHCLDSKGREVIVFGKGIGFYKKDEEIPLNEINRTFYNIKDTDYGIIRNIPTTVINAAIYIIDEASERLSLTFPSSSAIALADHLNFAIERKDKNIYLPQPLIQDIMQLYPDEMNVAFDSLQIIKRMTGVSLPRQEAGTIALHFINDSIKEEEGEYFDTSRYIEEVTEIIEDDFDVKVERESFNYSRFVTHMDYLIRRLINKEQIESKNQEIYGQMKDRYEKSVNCSGKIGDYLKQHFGMDINQEELLYLSIHINRLIERMEE